MIRMQNKWGRLLKWLREAAPPRIPLNPDAASVALSGERWAHQLRGAADRLDLVRMQLEAQGFVGWMVEVDRVLRTAYGKGPYISGRWWSLWQKGLDPGKAAELEAKRYESHDRPWVGRVGA